MVEMDIFGVDPVQGWSFSLCFDPTEAQFIGSRPGTTTETVNLGNAADFLFIGEELNGVNMLVVICFEACATLAPGEAYPILELDFIIIQQHGLSTDLTFCETIGNPPTEVLLVVDDSGIEPVLDDGAIHSVAPLFTFAAEDRSFGYDPVTGLGTLSEKFFIQEEMGSLGLPNSLEGFSMAIGHDSTLFDVGVVNPGVDLIALNGGSGPDFFASVVSPGVLALGCVFAFIGDDFLQAETAAEVVDLTYVTVASTFAGNFTGGSTSLVWADGIGVPPTTNVVSIFGETYTPSFIDGQITYLPIPPITDLSCSVLPGGVDVDLTWLNQAVYDSIEVRRDGVLIDTLAGDATAFADGPLAAGPHAYALNPILLGATGSAAECVVGSAPPLAGLACSLESGSVVLTWNDPGPGYDSIRVLRDASEIASLPGDSMAYTDIEPLPGLYSYSIRGVSGSTFGDLTECMIEVPDQPDFIRGDANIDNLVNIADSVFMLAFLFTSGPSFCLDAQDANDDGVTDIADPVYFLAFLFTMGAAPDSPFPDCGQDPTDDLLECAMYSCP